MWRIVDGSPNPERIGGENLLGPWIVTRQDLEIEMSTKSIGSVPSRILKCSNGKAVAENDILVVEEPLEMAVKSGGELTSVGISMRTPGDDRNLVLGFLFNEGVIVSPRDVVSMIFKEESDATLPATRVTITLTESVLLDTDRMDRAFPISAACGACGKSALEALKILRQDRFPVSSARLKSSALNGLGRQLFEQQSLFSRTGGLHASGRFSLDGRLLGLAEDVGRHNGMDKLVGASLQAGSMDWSDEVLLMSGRVGYDLMQKAIMVGAPIVASIGAPSSLAVELANLYQITLVGFLRETRFNVYSMPERIEF